MNSKTVEAVYKLNFITNYNQFYICDKESPHNTGSNFWSGTAYEDRLALDNGIIGVGIESYGHVKAELNILKRANDKIDIKAYDHVVEGGIELKSGVLQIMDCPASHIQLEVKINPDRYRVRVYSINLSNVITDEYEGHDHYKIEMWPDDYMERKVLKRYPRD